ncbi:MAG: DUF167 domain-containing protein [Proteobacteria bacterium]|jgi:uncharacterized protein|nr:DUF167 domain-containing protein [Pseudomonadota bacterium]
MKLKVKVVPGASRTEIVGWLGDELKVRVIAVPEKGKANTAVVKVLAMALGIANSDIKLLSGATFQHKTFEINGLEDTVIAKLMSADLT